MPHITLSLKKKHHHWYVGKTDSNSVHANTSYIPNNAQGVMSWNEISMQLHKYTGRESHLEGSMQHVPGNLYSIQYLKDSLSSQLT